MSLQGHPHLWCDFWFIPIVDVGRIMGSRCDLLAAHNRSHRQTCHFKSQLDAPARKTRVQCTLRRFGKFIGFCKKNPSIVSVTGSSAQCKTPFEVQDDDLSLNSRRHLQFLQHCIPVWVPRTTARMAICAPRKTITS